MKWLLIWNEIKRLRVRTNYGPTHKFNKNLHQQESAEIEKKINKLSEEKESQTQS